MQHTHLQLPIFQEHLYLLCWGAEQCCLSLTVPPFTSSCHFPVPPRAREEQEQHLRALPVVPRWPLSEAAMATLLLYMASKPIQGTER